LANGRAAAELHLEEKQRAEYLAAINRQKARELELALERKTQELKEAELKFTTAFGISPVGIWIARPDGHVEFANEVYREWSGLGDADNLDNWIDKVHPDDLAAVEAQFRLCYKTKVKHEFRFLTGETDESGVPTVRWIEGIAQAAVGPNINPETGEPEVLFATGALTDVTLRKQAEAFQARRADDNLAMRRQLEDFVDYASHEHRTPLFGMGMAIQSLKDHLQPLKNFKEAGQMQAVESALHDADIVSLCISHMQRLADDILLLSKLDRDMLVMAMAPCQPIQIARDVAKMVIAAERDVEYALSTSHQYDKLVEWISVDPQRVAQVLLNLVNNSIKFTRNRPSRKIKIHLDASLTKPPSNYPEFLENETIATTTTEPQRSDPVVLVISVEDNGIGMEEAEAKKLFQRFQ
jgi:signal transduction histidine kinase